MFVAPLLMVMLSGLYSVHTHARTIRVAVAANFAETAEALATRFTNEQGVGVQISRGSSGKLYAQIQHGAPFDVFLSADQEKPARLVNQQLAVADTLTTYALGRLVLLSSSDKLPASGADVLSSAELSRLAIANPDLAPYGAAAVAFLHNTNNVSRTRDKWVMGENIGQTFQFVFSGNAQLGLVARSQLAAVMNRPDFSYWLVPDTLHPQVRQDMVILRKAAERPAVQRFWRFLLSEQSQQVIKNAGYDIANDAVQAREKHDYY